MKTKLFACMMALFITIITFAQNEKYLSAMQKNIALLDSARSPQDFQQLANTFGRIASAEKSEWHPYYYAAYALVMQSYMETNVNKIDPMLDKADEMISMAESIQPHHSEISTVKAMIMQSRMRVDMSRGMTLGPKASELLQQAMQQKPAANPRTMMNMAQTLYYTPEAFGGSKKKALELMQQTLARYDSFEPATSICPNWGKAFVAQTLREWQNQ